MENYQNLINEALGGGTPKECYNNLMDILQERLNNKPAVNHHDELVKALQGLITAAYCIDNIYDEDTLLNAAEKAELVLSKLPTQ